MDEQVQAAFDRLYRAEVALVPGEVTAEQLEEVGNAYTAYVDARCQNEPETRLVFLSRIWKKAKNAATGHA